MSRDVTEQYHQDHRTLQAFSSLLTLVEALANIPGQAENAPPITLAAAAKSFTEIANQVLECKYVGLFALDPPDERQRILASSGLPPEEEQRLRQDTGHTPLADYVNATVIEQLHANQAVLLDLKYQPFVTTRSIHGARYRLVAPMMLNGQMIGFFTMAKTEEGHPDVQSAYTPEEVALARGIAKLAAQIIERVSLLQEQARAKANEQKFQETTRRYEDCLSTTSHELRTPLTTIKGNLQLAQRRFTALGKRVEPSPEMTSMLQRVEQPLKEALQNFGRLERMISELLDYSRIQAEKFVLREQTCNLIEVVRHAVEDTQKTLNGREILLSLPERETIPVYADRDRIGDVMHNFLTNAHKYSPAELPIKVSLSVEGTRARVAVRDEGAGIPAAEQARVWERFYRVPGIEVLAHSTSDSNLGLGLYLCAEIIELHHGQVGVDSAPGQGSTFWFTLNLDQSGG